MLKESQAAHWLFLAGIAVFAIRGLIVQSNERATDLLYLYSLRTYQALWDYSAAASSALRDVPSQELSPSVLEATRHGVGLSTWTPAGQPVRIYSYGAGGAATLYAVVPFGGNWSLLGGAVYVVAANRLGVRAGTVEQGVIVSRAGGWSIPLSALPGLSATDNDLVVRVHTLKE